MWLKDGANAVLDIDEEMIDEGLNICVCAETDGECSLATANQDWNAGGR